MAEKTRKVFLGHDTWPIRIGGKDYGPGTVEVPEDVAVKLEKAVARISGGTIDAKAVHTPRPVKVVDLTDKELLAEVERRGLAPEPDKGGAPEPDADDGKSDHVEPPPPSGKAKPPPPPLPGGAGT